MITEKTDYQEYKEFLLTNWKMTWKEAFTFLAELKFVSGVGYAVRPESEKLTKTQIRRAHEAVAEEICLNYLFARNR